MVLDGTSVMGSKISMLAALERKQLDYVGVFDVSMIFPLTVNCELGIYSNPFVVSSC